MLNTQHERDCATLQAISARLHDLHAKSQTARDNLGARERGFFFPPEDDQAKQLFLTYRNHRIALYEIISRHQEAPAGEEYPGAPSFVLAFGAAVLLCNWSSRLVRSYRDEPAIRSKLNEADPRFGIEANLFDEIYRNLTRIETQERLLQAAHYFDQNVASFQESFSDDDDLTWLISEIQQQYELVKRSWLEIRATRWRRDFDIVPRVAIPFLDAIYNLKSWFIDLCGGVWLDEVPEIPHEHVRRFDQLLQPGDFFLIRPERKSSTVFLPGWWTHGALYFGGSATLRQFGACDLPFVSKALHSIERPIDGQPAKVIEALAAGVVLNPLTRSLHADHVVAFRPCLNPSERLQTIDDVFSHLGKPYDFEFDLSRSDRLVCTELLYRALHGKGRIEFTPQVRVGRLTISADDIVSAALDSAAAGKPLFEIVAVSTRNMDSGDSQFLVGEDGTAMLRESVKDRLAD